MISVGKNLFPHLTGGHASVVRSVAPSAAQFLRKRALDGMWSKAGPAGASTCSNSTSLFLGRVFRKKFWRNFPKVEDSSLKEAAKKYGKQDFWTANFHLHTVCPISSPHSCLKCRMPRIPNTPRKKPTWHYGRWSFPSSESSLQRGGPFSGVLCLRCFVPFFFAGSNRVTRQAVKVHLRLMCRGVGCLLVAIRCFVLLVGLKTQGPVNGRYIHRFDMEYSRKGTLKVGSSVLTRCISQERSCFWRLCRPASAPGRWFWFFHRNRKQEPPNPNSWWLRTEPKRLKLW